MLCLVLDLFSFYQILLMPDASYSCFILVLDHDDMRDIGPLDAIGRLRVLDKSVQLARVIQQVFRPHKLTAAARHPWYGLSKSLQAAGGAGLRLAFRPDSGSDHANQMQLKHFPLKFNCLEYDIIQEDDIQLAA